MILPGAAVSSLLITCQNKAAVERNYIPAIRLGGWMGEILVATPRGPAPSLDGVIGLLLPGGFDIHPRWWDEEEALHHTSEPDDARDELEIPLVREAWRRGLPILGICRGEQMLNVALGGSLVQDISHHYGLAERQHLVGSSEEAVEAHRVTVAPGSRLARLVGDGLVTVNSRHHQAVLTVAPCLRAVAWFHDRERGVELVEGVEAADGRWAVGVQWHPENLVRMPNGTGKAALGIFRGFAAALNGVPAAN
jgi:putative glutamine amidotransferase